MLGGGVYPLEAQPHTGRLTCPTVPVLTLAGGLDAGTNRPFGLNSQYRPSPSSVGSGQGRSGPQQRADPRVRRGQAGESGRTASFQAPEGGARLGRTSGGAPTLYSPPLTRPPRPLPAAGSQALPHSSAGRCPPGALATCRALTTRGALNAGFCYPRSARIPAPAAPPHPAASRSPGSARPLARLPAPRVPSGPVPSGPRPLLPPRPRFLLSPPSRHTSPRGPGSHLSHCFPLGALCFVEVTWQPRSPPTGGEARWVGTGCWPGTAFGVLQPLSRSSGEKHPRLGLVASLSQRGSPAMGDSLPGEAAAGPRSLPLQPRGARGQRAGALGLLYQGVVRSGGRKGQGGGGVTPRVNSDGGAGGGQEEAVSRNHERRPCLPR